MFSIIHYIIIVEKLLFLLIAIGYYLYFTQKKILIHNLLLIVLIFISIAFHLLNSKNSFLFCITKGIKLYVFCVVGTTLWNQRTNKEENCHILYLVTGIVMMIVYTFLLHIFLRPEISDNYSIYIREYINTSRKFYVLIHCFFIAPISEEIYYRCYYLEQLLAWTHKKRYSIIFSIILTAISFAISHTGIYMNDIIKIVQIIPLGIILGYITYRTNVVYSILMHIFYNIGLLLFPFIINPL